MQSVPLSYRVWGFFSHFPFCVCTDEWPGLGLAKSYLRENAGVCV